MATGAPNVWTQMNYVPPRGHCNHKPSLLAAKCPCLRFMLHPLKSSSSYECDGCGHHASFHTMENKAEDEIRKRWEVEANERAEREEGLSKKRVRAIEYNKDDDLDLGLSEGEMSERLRPNPKPRNNANLRDRPKAKARAAPRKKPTPRAASSKTYEELMAEVMTVDLD